MMHSILKFGGKRAAERAADRAIEQTSALKQLSDYALAERFSCSSSNVEHSPIANMAERLALAAEAVKRTSGLAPYRTQLIAASALQNQTAVEMATGEGKTIALGIAAALLAKRYSHVHLMTANEYLAARDFEQINPALNLLGIDAGLLSSSADEASKREIYKRTVCYGVGSEFGFDFLRDQLKLMSLPNETLGDEVLGKFSGLEKHKPNLVQKALSCAIVDELDSILIDEANSSLVISAAQSAPCEHPAPYLIARDIVSDFIEGKHFAADRSIRRCELSAVGLEELVQKAPPVTAGLRRAWPDYVLQALRAKLFFEVDNHYVVIDNEICIIDEGTGRAQQGRFWTHGLHQAIEAFENVPLTEETESVLSISRQNYFSRYSHLCGTSGTIAEVQRELKQIYGLNFELIEARKPRKFHLFPDRIFSNTNAKYEAVAAEAQRVIAVGRPVLIGTRSVESSEAIAARLKERGILYALLNAKQDEQEAKIISEAGEAGRVTVATNMAGRGADIPVSSEIEALGGLHVIGTERHESRRIDRQLVGRAARQGQKGSAIFYLSLHDELLRESTSVQRRRPYAISQEGGELKHSFQREIRKAQSRHEESALKARRRAQELDKQYRQLSMQIGRT